MDFPTPNQSRDVEVRTLFLTLNTMKVDAVYLVKTFATPTLEEGKHK